MYILAFDTTAAACSVGLYKDAVEVAKTAQRMEFGQSEILLPEIKKMLKSVNKEVKDLDLMVVCIGPGSFTGVRSSIAAARAFNIALPDLKIIGVTAFEAYINNVAEDELAEVNAVIIETKREDFYFQLFDKVRKPLTEPATGFRDEILSRLKGKKVTVIGDGVERFLSQPAGLSFHAIKMDLFPPVDKLALVGGQKAQSGIKDFPKPLYLRAPDVFRGS